MIVLAVIVVCMMALPTMLLFDTMMQVHLVDNVKRRDEKYWLPGQPEEAYFCVRVRCMYDKKIHNYSVGN